MLASRDSPIVSSDVLVYQGANGYSIYVELSDGQSRTRYNGVFTQLKTAVVVNEWRRDDITDRQRSYNSGDKRKVSWQLHGNCA